MDQIKEQQAKVVLEEPTILEITVIPSNWQERLLQKFNLFPSIRKFEIKPITLGNLIRISEKLLGMENFVLNKPYLEQNYHLMFHHLDQMIEVAAIAIHNKKDLPPRSLINLLKFNVNNKELFAIIQVILNSMDISNFMNSIISVKGVNVMADQPANVTNADKSEVSQLPEETIAPGTSSVE